MKLNAKVQGGALQMVLFIGAIIALLLLSFVLLAYSHNLFQKKTDVAVQVIQTTENNLRLALSGSLANENGLNNTEEGELGIEKHISTKQWGLFDIMTSKAQKGKFGFEKMALVGHYNPNKAALYLTDKQRPMVLAGRARVTGTAYLPVLGAKTGNIYGNSYTGAELIFGEVKHSNESILPLKETTLSRMTDLLGSGSNYQGETINFKDGIEVKNSFNQPLIIIEGSTLDLQNESLTGNILVRASNKIVVGPKSKLTDVILVAPKIEIQGWVKGNFQALASESISVGKHCELAYPSCLAVYDRTTNAENENKQPKLEIEEFSEVKGTILYAKGNEERLNFPQIKIRENASLKGNLYCQGNLELKGMVKGQVVTNGFIAVENGNIYQNHLYNGSINIEALDHRYVGMALANEENNKVAKWLY